MADFPETDDDYDEDIDIDIDIAKHVMKVFDENYSDDEFAEMAPIYHASNAMYIEHKAKYDKQTEETKIKPPSSKRSQHEIDNKINLFSHAISFDLLKIIFKFAINPKPRSDPDEKKDDNIDLHPRRLPITLLKVCKNWRLCIMKTNSFWQPVIDYVLYECGEKGMTWKKLITVPDKYLNQFATNFFVESMNENERKKWSELTGEDPDYFGIPDTFGNMFLLIQSLKRCRNVYSLYLGGSLCDDVFYAIGKYCNDLRSLQIPFVQSGNPHWFRHLVKEGNKCKDTLFEISCERSYWVGDECLQYFAQLNGLQSLEMDRLFEVSAKGLSYLFDGDRQSIMKNIELTRGIIYQDSTIEFMNLMIKNGPEMVRINFRECEGVHDGMLKLLEDKEALPNLKYLDVTYTGCTTRAVNKLREKRPDIDIEFTPNGQ